jgi:archaetidylinositol phosphate synthase
MIKDIFYVPWLRTGIGKTCRFLSPNAWTTISLITAIAAFMVVAAGHVFAGMALFLFSGLCDFIDGSVAQLTGKSSKLGAFWDGTVDRFVDALMIGCFFFLPFPYSQRHIDLILFILLFMTLMPPFIVAYANHRGAVPDPTERVIWRFAFRVEYYLIVAAAIVLNLYSQQASYYLLLASLLLMTATVVQSIILVFIKSRNYV